MNNLYRAGIFKKILLPVLFFILFISITREASAQAGQAVKLEAHAGLDGVCRTGAWLPVRVTVENTGADIEARVQASYQNGQGGQSVYAADISLPATSRKEFFLYVYPTGSVRSLRVSVLEGKTILVKKDLNVSCAGNDFLSFGVLADDPAPYNILNDIRALSGEKTSVAQLTIADFPDRAQGWSALDALVVSNVDTGKLSAEQKQALKLWIANGGKLFVTGGINWASAAAGLRDILPVEITTTKNLTGLPALSAYVKDAAPLMQNATLAVGKNREGARVLVSQYEVPLLIEKQIGYGKVFYFAADPGLQPLHDWDGMKTVYEHLLAFKPEKPTWANAAWDSSQANRALSSLPELNLPSFLYICCWLGVYIVAIGPVNYFILRRVKRTELAWITIPVLVALFSCLAYVSGFAYRGVRPILNRFALGQGWDGISQARVNDLVGVYSPSRTTYNIQTQDQFMLYPPYGLDTDLQGSNDWLLLKNESGTTLPGVRVEIGGMRSIGAEGSMPALDIRHDLSVTMLSGAPVLEGTITNASGGTLREAVLVTPGNWYDLGDLAPNKPMKIKRSIINRPNSPVDMYTLLSQLGMSYPPLADKDLSRRSTFLQANLLSSNGSVTIVSGFYLMGWLDGVAAPVNLQDRSSSELDTMLYFHKITPGIITGSKSFLINSSLYDWESSIGTMTTYQITSDGYELRFQPSLHVEFSEVESLKINIQSNVVPSKVKISVWNFKSKAWTSITSTLRFIDVPDPAECLGADGEVRIKLNADQSDYVQINAVNFTLGVNP